MGTLSTGGPGKGFLGRGWGELWGTRRNELTGENRLYSLVPEPCDHLLLAGRPQLPALQGLFWDLHCLLHSTPYFTYSSSFAHIFHQDLGGYHPLLQAGGHLAGIRATVQQRAADPAAADHAESLLNRCGPTVVVPFSSTHLP